METADRRLDDHAVPTWIAVGRRHGGRVELRGVVRPWGERYRTSRILLVDEGIPLRWILWTGQEPSVARLAEEFGDELPGEPVSGRLQTTSLIVCTRDRPDRLRRCLLSVRAGIDPDVDVVVVDSAPRSAANIDVISEMAAEGFAVQRVVEPAPGLSRARNSGMASTDAEIVAFIDDDVLVEPGWLRPLRRVLTAEPTVGIAVGLVPSAEVETPAQLGFERRIPWSSRLASARLTLRPGERPPPPFPYNAGQIGTGANMALRRELAMKLGGFDTALGAGTWARGGEDLEMFIRALRAGWDIAYEPASIVWHLHEVEMAALRTKVFDYGAGASAYLTSVLCRPGRRDVVAALASLARFATERRSEQVRSHDDVQLEAREAFGLLWGPIAYGAERLRQRGLDRLRAGAVIRTAEGERRPDLTDG